MKIGIFDSGIGGLTVLNRAVKEIPDADFIYYADTDNVPYGTKTREQIIEYVDAAASFLTEKGCDALVVACNTATSAGIDFLRGKYSVPIVGMEPAVKPALAYCGTHKVLVTATPLTIRAEKLHDLIFSLHAENEVVTMPLPGLVEFCEKGIFDYETVSAYLDGELKEHRVSEFSCIVLGCTHFNYFKDVFAQYFAPGTVFVDGSAGTVRQLKKRLCECGNLSEKGTGKREFYLSGRAADDEFLKKTDAWFERLDRMYGIDKAGL